MNKKALITALLWAAAVEFICIVLKFGFKLNIAMLGVHIGVIITSAAEYFIVRSKEIAAAKKKLEADRKLRGKMSKKKRRKA